MDVQRHTTNTNCLLCPTVQVPRPQFVGFGRYGHTELPMRTYQTNTSARSSKSNVDVTILQHILINANPCCVLRYKFHVFKLQGSGDMVTQNYQCVQNHEAWFTSRTHSSNCDGDVTMLEHVFINLNLCCIQWYKFRVCRGKGSRDTVTQYLPVCIKIMKNGLFHGLTAPYLMGMSQYFYIPL